jgi:tRNA-Thr(GGU) m(6)t(6)A37 methyltransferase TsaA
MVRQIGVVRSDVSDRKAMPSLGAPAALELFPEFADGLLRFEKHSHIWVMAWLDAAQRDVLQVIPRGCRDRSPAGLHGVFAVRSPARPNPIGLTATRVLRMEGTRIYCERLDFQDGTPVLDVKPYFLSRDMIFSAVNTAVGLPVSPEAMRESLIMQAVNYHGELCEGLALAVRVVEDYRTRVYDLGEPKSWLVEAPATLPCAVDALIGMTRTSLGRGTLRLVDRLEIGLCGAVYEIAAQLPHGFDAVIAAPANALFREKMPS